MNAHKIEPERIHWDAIVIGTGMGGSAAGYELARKGWKVLFCEQGLSSLHGSSALRGQYAELFPGAATPEGRRETFRAAGRWVEPLQDVSTGRTVEHVPFLGAGTGGSTALYGGALERFWPEDFDDEKNGWPFSHETLAPWYEKAERLFEVRGEPDPLRSDRENLVLKSPPPLSESNEELVDYLSDRGMHPYRLPIAADFRQGCTTCQGYLCKHGCKRDSSRVFLQPALEHEDVALLDDCKVKRLEADRSRVTAVECVWKGRPLRLKATVVILAAGALATPLLLLSSRSDEWPSGLANGSDMVGRNLMRHFIDLYALFPRKRPAPGDDTKQIAFSDFFVDDKERLGCVQSFGWLPPARVMAEDMQEQIRQGPLSLLAPLFGAVKPIVRLFLDATVCRSLILATTLEDRPYPQNRVMLGEGGRMSIRYCIEEEGKKRIEAFRHRMSKLFSGMRHMVIRQAENNQRLAHACGTCRMGEDPAKSVVDPQNRAHEVENLYIVDASFFPSSGSTNPSLTIAANALRVANHIAEQNR